MPKVRTGYCKKRRFHGNQHSKRKHTRASEGDGIPSTADTNTKTSASSPKIPLRKQSESSNRKAPSTDPSITGFRLVDLEILDSVQNFAVKGVLQM